jgi:hypothetical protein
MSPPRVRPKPKQPQEMASPIVGSTTARDRTAPGAEGDEEAAEGTEGQYAADCYQGDVHLFVRCMCRIVKNS